MASRTVYTSTALEVLTSANFEKMPKGWLGYLSTVTSTTGITSETNLTGLSLAVTVPASRLIVVEGYCFRVSSDTTDDLANFRIKEGGSQLAESRVDVGNNSAGNGGTFGYVATAPFSPSAGSHTYNLTGSLAAGTGDLQFRAGSGSESWIRVIDIGPSS